MTDLQNLISSTPLVIVLDSVSPYCHKLADFFDENFQVPQDRLAKSYTDKGENGPKIEQASKEESKSCLQLSNNGKESVSLPHVYIGGHFIYGGEDFKHLRKGKLRNQLIKAGAIDLPNKEKVEEMIKANKVVVFLNEFSPFSFSTKDIMVEAAQASQSKDIKFIYVDKCTDSVHIEQAALYLADAENLPVVFAGGKPLGDGNVIESLHKNFKLFDALAESGFVRKPAHSVLAKMKKDHAILVVGNDYSPFCLEAKEVLSNIPMSAGDMVIDDTSSEINTDLQHAARVDTKQRAAPYIYIAGVHMSTTEFFQLTKDKKLESYLTKKGVL